MAKKPLPSQEVLRQLLRYEPKTGKLFWRERAPGWFHTDDPRGNTWAANCWNKRFAGKEAVKNLSRDGYGVVAIFREPYYAHRLIWKIETGEEPIEIDHINGDRLNNRMSNLRNVMPIENSRNRRIPKNNTTGCLGVHRLPNGSFHVRSVRNGRRVSIGTFATIEAAREAKKKADRMNGFHPNHGCSVA